MCEQHNLKEIGLSHVLAKDEEKPKHDKKENIDDSNVLFSTSGTLKKVPDVTSKEEKTLLKLICGWILSFKEIPQ